MAEPGSRTVGAKGPRLVVGVVLPVVVLLIVVAVIIGLVAGGVVQGDAERGGPAPSSTTVSTILIEP